MKKTFILSFLLVLSHFLVAQNSTDPLQQTRDTTTYAYCQIVGTGRLMSNKVTIEIDFGQFRSIWEDNRLKDPNTGERIVFNGMIDALNYMGKNGWEFIQAYAFSQGNGPMVYHYILKKPVTIIEAEDKKP